MQKRSARFGIVLTLMLLGCGGAKGALDISAVGLANMTVPSLGNSPIAYQYSGQIGIGFGAQLGIDVFTGFQIEGALLYVPRAYSNGFQTTTFTMLEIPVVLRFTALKIVNFAAGGYFAEALGNYTIQTQGATLASQVTYEATNISRSDFGLVASVGLNIPLAPEFKLLFDLRYYFGLENLYVNPNAGNLELRDLQLLAGVKLSL